ncbi:MAG: DUF4276 family protein [Sedimentisphaerales bacterium]|nr:DUF4276 family protein [Sedimentisphaerales bacterium]
MRILVVSEGIHERAGALENLLEKLGGSREFFESDRVSNNEIHAFHGKGPGYFKRAIRWLKEAEQRGVDVLIFLIDEDGKKERIEQIQNAQDYLLSSLPRAMGVAIRAFDAWMLADEKVLSQVLGYSINRQVNPETIRNPKKVCEELLGDSKIGLSQREMYAQVSNNIDINVLCERCPSGFKPFAAHVKEIFS